MPLDIDVDFYSAFLFDHGFSEEEIKSGRQFGRENGENAFYRYVLEKKEMNDTTIHLEISKGISQGFS